jgi:hypothetical protein
MLGESGSSLPAGCSNDEKSKIGMRISASMKSSCCRTLRVAGLMTAAISSSLEALKWRIYMNAKDCTYRQRSAKMTPTLDFSKKSVYKKDLMLVNAVNLESIVATFEYLLRKPTHICCE